MIRQLQESAPDMIITLKKRPKHTKIYGPIYMKPYRLPSKKRTQQYRWGGDSIPSPRMELQPIQHFPIPEKSTIASSESDCSDILTPTNEKPSEKELRLYLPKPRAVLQRRNTICGDRVSGFKSNFMFWHESLKPQDHNNDDSPSLRDKSVSFGFGLELAQRPTTCLGIGNGAASAYGKFNDFSGLKGSLPEITNAKASEQQINENANSSEQIESKKVKSKPGISKVVRFDSTKTSSDYAEDSKYTCNVEDTILEVFEPIPYVDEEELSQNTTDHIESVVNSVNISKPNDHLIVKNSEAYAAASKMFSDNCLAQAINEVLVKRERHKRGTLHQKEIPSGGDSTDSDSG